MTIIIRKFNPTIHPWELSNRGRPRDFDVAEIAKTALQKTVDEFNENAKPTTLQRMGFSGKSTKEKAVEVLAGAANGDLEDLKASIDNLDETWKGRHGRVSLTSHCS